MFYQRFVCCIFLRKEKKPAPGVVEDISPQGLSQKQLSCSLGEGTFRLYDTQMLNETGLFTYKTG